MLMEMSLTKFDIYQCINQKLQTVLRATQTLYVQISFKKIFCLMSDLKFTVSDVTSVLPAICPGFKKSYIQPWPICNGKFL